MSMVSLTNMSVQSVCQTNTSQQACRNVTELHVCNSDLSCLSVSHLNMGHLLHFPLELLLYFLNYKSKLKATGKYNEKL